MRLFGTGRVESGRGAFRANSRAGMKEGLRQRMRRSGSAGDSTHQTRRIVPRNARYIGGNHSSHSSHSSHIWPARVPAKIREGACAPRNLFFPPRAGVRAGSEAWLSSVGSGWAGRIRRFLRGVRGGRRRGVVRGNWWSKCRGGNWGPAKWLVQKQWWW